MQEDLSKSGGNTTPSVSQTYKAEPAIVLVDKQAPPKSKSINLEPKLLKKIDLNAVFSSEGKDLNVMFPEEDLRILLHKVNTNLKDIALMNERLQKELQFSKGNVDEA